MTPTASLFECLTNVPHTVLGKRLKPLCLLHLLWLYHIGSPLVNTAKETTLADLQTAVVICSSTTPEEILGKLKADGIRQRLWKLYTRKQPLEEQILKFIAYYTDYFSLPDFQDSTETKDDKIPWLMLCASALVKNTGWDANTVWTMPVGQVIWYNLSFGYITTGESNIVSDKQLEARRMLEALQQGGSK